MNPPHRRVWICLCQASDIRNIGGAARAVANFGLAGLKIINPRVKALSREDLHTFSSGASEIIEIQRFDTLLDGLEEADLLIGTSRRRRDHPHLSPHTAQELSTLIDRAQRPHLLFGNERTGLTHEELDLCQASVEIHSDPSFPSLNLAHAVACLAYELSRPLNVAGDERIGGASPSSPLNTLSQVNTLSQAQAQSPSLTTVREDEAFLQRVIEVCTRTNFPPGKSSERYARQLRSLIRRAKPKPGDYGMILGLFRELERLSSPIKKDELKDELSSHVNHPPCSD